MRFGAKGTSAVRRIAGLSVIVVASLLGACAPTSTAPPSASGTASPTAPLVNPTSPTRAPAPSGPPPVRQDAFGIVAARDDLVVHSETSDRPLAIVQPGSGSPIPLDLLQLAVSPDRRSVVYWTQPLGGSNALRRWDANDPARVSTLLDAPDGERGTLAVWSADGAALLLSFDSVRRLQGIDAPPERTVLRTYELAARQLRDLVSLAATSLAPVAYDRSRQLAAAVELGGGSFATAYLLVRSDGQVARTPLRNVLHATASQDAGWVVVSADIQTAGRLVAWPVADPGRVVELHPETDRQLLHLGWLPGSTQVLVATMPRIVSGPTDAVLSLWDPSRGTRSAIAGDPRGRAVPRADGSALYVSDESGTVTIVEIASGRREGIAGLREAVLAGVRLR